MKGLFNQFAIVMTGLIGITGVGCTSNSTSLCPPTLNSCNGSPANNMDIYDPCWPDRYGNLAQREVNRAMAPQVLNGHVLDQTVWNHHFEPGTPLLTEAGLAHLQYLSRRRPEPDRSIYLASSKDLPYDPNAPERFAGARQELDSLRVAAIQKYLVACNAGRNQDFQVFVHDPADVSISTVPASISVQGMYARFRGGLITGGGGGAAAGPSGSVGGFAGAGGAGGSAGGR